MAKKDGVEEALANAPSGLRVIELDEYNLTVKVDVSDNILAIIRKVDGKDVKKEKLPIGVYQLLARKLEQGINK